MKKSVFSIVVAVFALATGAAWARGFHQRRTHRYGLLVEDHSSARAKKPYAEAKKRVSDIVTIKGDMYRRGGAQAIVVESVAQE